MNERQLVYFLTVYKHKSIKKAAEELQVSEQAVSKTIIQFEKTLNLKLFIRHINSIEPTEDAHRIKKSADKILNEISCMLDQNPKNSLPEAFTIYAVENSAVSLSYELIKAFTDKYPQVLLNFMEANEEYVFEKLRNDEIELAILTHEQDSRIYHNISLFQYPYCAIISKENPLSEKDFIYNRDLDNQYVVTNGRSYDSYVRTTLQVLNNHINFLPKLETNSNYFMLEMVEHNDAIGLILQNAVQSLTLRNSVIKPIEAPNVFTYYLCYKKSTKLSNSAKKFKGFLLNWIGSHFCPQD